MLEDVGRRALIAFRKRCQDGILLLALEGVTEKLSHGEPTFFVSKRVFAMFSNNHHGDGHVAVWLPAKPGEQEMLISTSPETFFRPPYVGVKGWVGIELDQVSDEDLGFYVREAWKMFALKGKSGVRAGAN